MANINMQFFISMLIIALGYIMKRTGIITEADGDGIARIIFNLTLPALVINTFSTIKVDFNLILLPAICLLFGLLMSLLAIFVFRNEDRGERGMMSMCVTGFNIGLFAYPIIEAILGKEGLKYFAMLDMGNAFLIFGVCYMFACYFSPTETSISAGDMVKKVLKSIPLMAYIITLIFNLLGIRFPSIILDISQVVSRANMPLSLLLLGICLSFSPDIIHLKKMAKVISIRYAAGIAAGALLFFLLPFNPLFRCSLLIGFVLPIGMSVIPYSVQFNYDKKFVGTLTNTTLIISFILMWIILRLIAPSLNLN